MVHQWVLLGEGCRAAQQQPAGGLLHVPPTSAPGRAGRWLRVLQVVQRQLVPQQVVLYWRTLYSKVWHAVVEGHGRQRLGRLLLLAVAVQEHMYGRQSYS